MFDLTSNQTQLLGWLQFYEMINNLDEVERPDDRVMEDDEKLDKWYKKYRADVKKRLIKYHKDTGTKNIDHDPPKPRRGFVYGGDDKK